MQATEILDVRTLSELINAIFEPEVPEVLSADSAFGAEIEKFGSAEEIIARIISCVESGKSFHIAVRYPTSGGRMEVDRVSLDPTACKGHTFRYTAGGWGVIYLQLYIKHKPDVECRIAVNSEKRALLWETHESKWAPVSDWKWPVVDKQARRLIRKLKALAQQVTPTNVP